MNKLDKGYKMPKFYFIIYFIRLCFKKNCKIVKLF